MAIRTKLIEVALPLDAINAAAQADRRAKAQNPSTLHLWWSRKPLPACRAVLFAQLVDDPTAWSALFPDEQAQEIERQRLFSVLVDCANGRNRAGVQLEVARSLARARLADETGGKPDRAVLAESPAPATVQTYLRDVAPPVHDPFVGSGSTALAARWLGLRAVVSDLNPVAVLISRAALELPTAFNGRPAVLEPVEQPRGKRSKLTSSLAQDAVAAAAWMRDEAARRLGEYYPRFQVDRRLAKAQPWLAAHAGQELPVLAWLWARTIASPDPAVQSAHVPLMSTCWLSKGKGREFWVEPVVDTAARTYRFAVRKGPPKDAKAVGAGTKAGTGAQFRCVLGGASIPADYVKHEAAAGRLGRRLVALILDGPEGPLYAEATPEAEEAAQVPAPPWAPTFELVKNSRHMCPWAYGGETYDRLFLPRQLLAMVTMADLVHEVRGRITSAAAAEGFPNDPRGLEEGGRGARAYGDAIAVYLACAVDRFADYWSTLSSWEPVGEAVSHAFTRQALAMNWNIAEGNPFSARGGSFDSLMKWTLQSIPYLQAEPEVACEQRDATSAGPTSVPCAVSTDPPYGNTVPYGDISDFFYVWLRRSLRDVYPRLFGTVLVPKEAELIADPFRHGSAQRAQRFFTDGMARALGRLLRCSAPEVPVTVFYAFKQAESRSGGKSATGWETFLEGLLGAGLGVLGTWPLRTETGNRMRARGSNALASSIVLVCRQRDPNGRTTSQGDFRRRLVADLPHALRTLQQGNIAPVDLAQAALGPGMALFSQYSKVLDAAGNALPIRAALQLINELLDQFLTEGETELDPLSRFAVTWFEAHGLEAGDFGEAETLAKARNVSVERVAEAGILHAAAGRVRLLKTEEVPTKTPVGPATPSWVLTQRLLRELEDEGEDAAAALCQKVGASASQARDLAYRLHHTAERRGWAELALAFNGLVVAWPDLERLASAVGPAERSGV